MAAAATAPAGLLAVAAVPLVAGITPAVYEDPARFGHAAGRALLACGVLLAVGGLLSWATVRSPSPSAPPAAAGPVSSGSVPSAPVPGPVSGGPVRPATRRVVDRHSAR
jgi:hypothetical protein